jgi:hypothetical protein
MYGAYPGMAPNPAMITAMLKQQHQQQHHGGGHKSIANKINPAAAAAGGAAGLAGPWMPGVPYGLAPGIMGPVPMLRTMPPASSSYNNSKAANGRQHGSSGQAGSSATASTGMQQRGSQGGQGYVRPSGNAGIGGNGVHAMPHPPQGMMLPFGMPGMPGMPGMLPPFMSMGGQMPQMPPGVAYPGFALGQHAATQHAGAPVGGKNANVGGGKHGGRNSTSLPVCPAMGYMPPIGGWPMAAAAAGQFGVMAPGMYAAAGMAPGAGGVAGKQQHGGGQGAGGMMRGTAAGAKAGWSK